MPRGKKSGRAAKASRARSLLLSQGRDQVALASRPSQPTNSHAFTLKDEARNTGHSRLAWDRDARLRSRPVGFVSAGVIEPLKQPTADHRSGDDESSPPEGTEQGCVDTDGPVLGQVAPGKPSLLVSEVRKSSETVAPSGCQPEPEGPGLYFVDVSGDKTLSTGKEEPPKISSPRSLCDESSSSDEDVILFTGRATANRGILAPSQPAIRAQDASTVSHNLRTTTPPHPPNLFDGNHARSSSRAAAGHVEASEDDEAGDSVVADYLSNLADDGDGDSTILQAFSLRALGGSDDEFDLGGRRGGSEYLLPPAQDDDEPTSAEAVGTQSSSQSSSSENEAGAEEVDDEKLARMLAKQEELGLGSDELILFSQEFGGSEARTLSASSEGQGRAKTSRHKQSKWQPQGATALANALDEIDLGDWDQRGPPRKAKGRLGEVHFGLSDSELEETVRASWKKDRVRKKERKQERETLRAQGLLGKHADANDPRTKYGSGMTLDDIKSELRAFLVGSDPSLSLPPMDASARKIIHELANRFKIKSKSAGSGDQRRPALYRTKNTVSFVEAEFEYQFARVGRRFFPRLDAKSKSAKKSSGSGRVNNAAVTYRDGEVVGGSAPELGQSNKGRAMLERMGWSTGTGLGASDNTGILQPVAHVVKRTKAGLG